MDNKSIIRITRVLWIVLLGCFTGFASATDYYFDDTDGDDSWTGTADTFIGGSPPVGPWKSLGKLYSFNLSNGFQPGDRILFKRGGTFSYPFGITFDSSGTSQAYIEIAAYGNGNKPVLQNGFSVVDDANNNRTWTNPGNDIWFYDYTGAAVSGLWKGGIFQQYASGPDLSDGNFYWESGSGIYYSSPDGNTPNDDNLYRGGSNNFDIGGESYLKFKDLHFTSGLGAIAGGSTTTTPVHNIIIEDCEFSDLTTAISIYSRYGQNNHDITIKNNLFSRIGRGTMILANNGPEKNNNITITGNQFTDIDANGYYELFGETVGGLVDIETISVQNANDSIITDNVISVGAIEGGIIIWTNPTSQSNDNVITRNVIHDIGGAGINLFGTNTSDRNIGNIVHNNIIYNCTDQGAIRLSAKDASLSNSIYNNTIVNCGNSFFINGQTSGFYIFNNISLNPTGHHIQYNHTVFASVMNNNIYYPDSASSFLLFNGIEKNLAEWKFDTGQDAISVDDDPELADVNAADFHLTALSSAAIDKGIFVNQTVDFENNPIIGLDLPDIGAYEFGHNDSDGDGVIDYDEICFDGDCQSYDPYDSVTNPSGGDINISIPDTDGDGSNDGDEIAAGTDPLNSASTPTISAPAMGFIALLILWFGLAGTGLRFNRITCK